MSPQISIHIVSWNSMPFLPDLLDSIFKQTFTDFTVLVIDNGSTDGVAEFLKEQFPSVMCLRNVRNLGFCGAHNQGIRYVIEHRDEQDLENQLILIMNPNIFLTPTYLEELVRTTEGKESYGMFGGKVLRAYGDGVSDEALKTTVRSDRIDSVGLQLQKNFLCVDRGAGMLDEGQFDEAGEVFGIGGSLVAYRARALQAIRYQDEFFDQDFFTEKEDVDVAWRMQGIGLSAWYEPRAVAYHHRGMYDEEKTGWFARFQTRKNQSKRSHFYATRNQWLILLKHLDFVSFIVSFPRLVLIESLRCFATLFQGSNRRAIPQAIGLIPRMWKKRKFIRKTKQISGYQIRKQFAK